MATETRAPMATESRTLCKQIAESSLDAMQKGSYVLDDQTYPFRALHRIPSFIAPPTCLDGLPRSLNAIFEMSTIEAAQLLSKTKSNTSGSTDQTTSKVGILNFASAKNPGGGFLGGSRAQEESIARSSTLYQSLTSQPASTYYSSHREDPKGGYYSHAMIFSPNVTVFRDDHGSWIQPLDVCVVTSPAVNAGVVRKRANHATEVEADIELVMKERMARILFLFESRGVSKVVLGSFGTGVFRNSVPMVARIWAELLGVSGSRFSSSFQEVVFGILGKKTYEDFKAVFNEKCTGRVISKE